MGVPFSSEGGRVFAGRREGIKIPGGARRKGKGHDPQARGSGVRGSVFPPGESLASGSEGPEAFSPPRGIAARRLRRSVCTGLSPSVVMSDTLDAPGLSPAGRRCSRDVAEFGRPAQRRSASIAGRRPENAPLRGIRPRKANSAGSVKKTPVARMRQEQISGASADQMLW